MPIDRAEMERRARDIDMLCCATNGFMESRKIIVDALERVQRETAQFVVAKIECHICGSDMCDCEGLTCDEARSIRNEIRAEFGLEASDAE